eukprot:scaffold37611_cov35-Tisochrysis_lutea.AAC.1
MLRNRRCQAPIREARDANGNSGLGLAAATRRRSTPHPPCGSYDDYYWPTQEDPKRAYRRPQTHVEIFLTFTPRTQPRGYNCATRPRPPALALLPLLPCAASLARLVRAT